MSGPIRDAYTVPSGAEFGAPRAGGRHHQGTDYHCPIGTPIYATGDGHVVSNVAETGYGIGFGNYVSIAYTDGRMTLDGHLRERSSLAVGTLVTSRTIVGYVGITGNAVYADPPGSHDHHQVWLNGILTDPAAYYGTSTAGTGTPIPAPVQTKRKKQNKMADIIVAPNQSCAYLIHRPDGGMGKAQITNPAVIAQEAAAGNFTIPVSQNTYDAYATL